MKELSIEEKAKRYDDRLEKAKKWYDINTNESYRGIFEDIFPELCESEDEKTRKEIVRFIQMEVEDEIVGNKWLAWLEKQGEQDMIPLDKAIKFLDDQLVDDKNEVTGEPFINFQNYGAFKETFIAFFKRKMLEKQGGQKLADKVEPKFWVWYAGSIYNVFEIKDIAGVTFYGIEDEPNHIDYVKAENCDIISGYSVKEKGSPYPTKPAVFSEQKSADKVEPKFHEGEWIIRSAEGFKHNTYLVKEVKDYYACEDLKGQRVTFTLNDVHKNFKLWDISDAKAGDILFQDLMGGIIFIFDGVNPEMGILYSFIINNDGEDVLPYHIGKPNTGIGYVEENKNIIYPATREQRDLLFKKMKEAGYEWDADKKELKKIEQKPVTIDIDKMVNNYANNNEHGNEEFGKPVGCMIRAYRQGLNDAIRKVISKPAWSEKDESLLQRTISLIKWTHKIINEEGATELQDWLKSLKQRIGG